MFLVWLFVIPFFLKSAIRYVESIEDVISVFIRLHMTNIAPHAVFLDDLSAMHCRDKLCVP
jgi:hypothetical protein